jgi:predicted RecB family nuclease
MTPLTVIPAPGAGSEVAPVQVRLGPWAAARCRRRIHLDAAAGGPRIVLSTAARRALDDLAEHRELVIEQLRTTHGISAAVAETPESGRLPRSDGRLESRSPGTRNTAWRSTRAPIVLAPEMTTATRSGAADLLVWAGDGYLPVIIRVHRTRDRGAGAPISPLAKPLDVRPDPTHRVRRNRADRLTLAHHYRQLQALNCASATARGGVIGRGSPTDGAGRPDTIGGEDDGSVIVWHDLDGAGSSTLHDYDLRFDDRLAVASAAVSGVRPLAWPSRVAECRRCPWWARCGPELRAAADISLLLSGADVEVARAAGIRAIPELADLDPAAAKSLPLTVTQVGSAQVRARAWCVGAVLVRTDPRSAIRRADVELDVDAESYGEDGAYLWGAQLSGADVGLPPGYRSFVTWQHLPSPTQGAVFGQFFGYLMQVREAAATRGLSFAVYCYARAAEERWMLGLARRYSGLPGVPDPRAVAAFCASSQWVDLLLEIKRQFVATGSLRLKELASAIGYSWRDPEPGGENSMAWYRAAVDGQSDQSATSAAADAGSAHPMAGRVVRYNEDDVLATLAVRRWITEHLDELPTVADLQ